MRRGYGCGSACFFTGSQQSVTNNLPLVYPSGWDSMPWEPLSHLIMHHRDSGEREREEREKEPRLQNTITNIQSKRNAEMLVKCRWSSCSPITL